MEEGSIWYGVGRLADAENAYKDALRLDSKSFTGHDNLAFVLFDLGRYKDALVHWDNALQIQPNEADALAGKAIALEATGNRLAALKLYKLAVIRDRSFLDIKALQRSFVWSENACNAAKPLVEILSREEL